jgi:hypothetical protein
MTLWKWFTSWLCNHGHHWWYESPGEYREYWGDNLDIVVYWSHSCRWCSRHGGSVSHGFQRSSSLMAES